MKTTPLLALLLALPAAHAEWKPAGNKIMTQWAKDVTPDNAWDEYPRPQLQRENWTRLNGLWNYTITPKDAAEPGAWAGEILVPFCPESALSGVGKQLGPDQALWYERSFVTKKNEGKRTLINFEAVDYECTVWLNGKELGKHVGAHTPFSFDATDALKDGGNTLRVKVLDATGGFQMLGKQKLDPEGIWYTRVSGIWQSVWMEEVNARYIESISYDCDIKTGTIIVKPKLVGPQAAGESMNVLVEKNTAAGVVLPPAGNPIETPVQISNPELWSPDSPKLYKIRIVITSGGKITDLVTSYTALRELGKAKDKNGNWRFTLNGKPIFHWGPLDQGWWPDGLLTPPSEEAMISDIDFLKAAGFNMIRKHIKVEPRRYYYHCDQVGMMMWQDQVSMGRGPQTEPKGSNPPWTRMEPNPQEGQWPDAAHEQFVTEYKRMVDHLRDEPCIVSWQPFNEAWGQHRTMDTGKMAADYDKTRAINIASGGNFWPVGDVADEHAYPDPAFPLGDKRFDDYIKVVGEFGGHGWPVKDHLWDNSKDNWGYGGLPQSLDEWKARYSKSIDVLCGLRRQGISAGVYTQTTDVEGEINGLRTYDRIDKVPPAWLKTLSDKLLATPDAAAYAPIAATSEQQAQEWKYTTEAPATGWEAPGFDDKAWKTGKAGFGTRETPNTKVATEWNTSSIWIRREFNATAPKGKPVLKIFHDEDATVYLNGVQIAKLPGHNGSYALTDFDASALKTGKNVLAIEVKQTKGGQYIDAGIMDETIVK